MVILGEEEVKQGVVKMKDMIKRTEEVRAEIYGQGKQTESYSAFARLSCYTV